ncbi:MAG: hypothetical protein WAV11_00100, partial [Minisyncoccia bacterium]
MNTQKINTSLLTFVKIMAVSALVLAFVIPMLIPAKTEASMVTEMFKVLSGQHFHDSDTVVVEKKVYVNNPATKATISGYCYPNKNYANTNEMVNWSVFPLGGNGSYTYSWSGTDSLSGGSQSISKIYTRTGSKTASVTIYSSGASSLHVNCDSNIIVSDDNNNNNNNDDDDDLTVSCRPNTDNADTDERVTWTASVSGGTGSYRYDWDGTNNLSGSNNRVYKTYTSEGRKYASVTV